MNHELRTNANALVEMAVAGTISAPTFRRPGFIPDNDGVSRLLPGMAGMVYNVRVGDPAFGWAADHVEPGASIDHPDSGIHHALHYLTCVGNRAVVTSGEAAGAEGVVTGEHARLLVDFPEDVHDLLAVGDTVLIRTKGRGLALLDYPRIQLKKIGPELVERLPIRVDGDGRLEIDVAMELPVSIMASGAELNAEYVDQDLASGDREYMRELGVDRLRLGDLVAIRDTDHRYGRGYRRGAVAIGLCIHGDSVMTGHGPGILTLMASLEGEIAWRIDDRANLAHILGIRPLDGRSLEPRSPAPRSEAAV